jgi:hypothetical protein
MRNPHKVLVRKPEEKRHLKDFDIDGSVILKWILYRVDGCGLLDSG